MHQIYEPLAGDSITTTAEAMVEIANTTQKSITANFNDITVRAVPGESAKDVVARYQSECDQRRKEYRESPEYKQAIEDHRRAQKQADESLRDALAGAPVEMSLVENVKEEWEQYLKINSHDGYSKATMDYAQRWARLMEGCVARGEVVANCAEGTSHVADIEGITGFMYGAAVSTLFKFWKYGEELRRWHNLKTQIGSEGERANESGGVLNPAIINIG